MEDLPFGRIAALVPEFALKELPLGRTLMMMMHLQLRSETVTVRRRMNLVLCCYDCQVKPGDECEISDICLTVEEKP